MDDIGNVYITGYFASSTADFGSDTLINVDYDPGNYNIPIDGFVSKLNPAGDFLWARSFGGHGNDRSSKLALDSVGNVYLGGYFGERYGQRNHHGRFWPL